MLLLSVMGVYFQISLDWIGCKWKLYGVFRDIESLSEPKRFYRWLVPHHGMKGYILSEIFTMFVTTMCFVFVDSIALLEGLKTSTFGFDDQQDFCHPHNNDVNRYNFLSFV